MRLKTFNIIINSLFSLLVIGVWYIQIIKAPMYIKLSKNNRIRIVPITAPRGDIFDRRGTPLVNNRISFDCVVIPQELTDKKRSFSKLSNILQVKRNILEKALKKGFASPFTPEVIAKDIPKQKAIAIEEECLNMPGVFISTRPLRDYLYENLYAHLVGYISRIDEGELERLDRYGYRANDLIGKTGIEKEYDNYLRGNDGGMQIEIDNRGRQIRVLGSKRPEKGEDIYLTIDIELQKYIDQLLDKKKGACIVMDPNNGEILSLVSKPNFDLNLFVNSNNNRIRKLLHDPNYPMLNRAIQCAYPPGSSFKIVTAGAVLEERKIDTKSTFVCDGSYKVGGKIFHCWKEKGHGSQNIIEGIKNSCNVFFYNMGMLTGPDAISKYAERFGFGRPSGIDLPGEMSGLVPNRLWKRLKMGERWYRGETANYAIGQGYLLVTPIQILNMVSVIANRGTLYEPYVVKRIGAVDVSSKAQRKIGFSKETIRTIIRGMQKVVEDDTGTGLRARIEGISIAGKTGTAQTGSDATHAWFTGFSPIYKPKVALVVFLEEGGKGGLEPAKMAGQIFKKAKELDLL